MDDEYDEYRRWDGDVDVEVCVVILLDLTTSFIFHNLDVFIIIIFSWLYFITLLIFMLQYFKVFLILFRLMTMMTY